MEKMLGFRRLKMRYMAAAFCGVRQGIFLCHFPSCCLGFQGSGKSAARLLFLRHAMLWQTYSEKIVYLHLKI